MGRTKRDFLSMEDFSRDEIDLVLRLSRVLKARRRDREARSLLEGLSIAAIFEKPSSRTRLSFGSAMYELGGNTLYLTSDDIKPGEREPYSDIARVTSRYVHGIVIRAKKHASALEVAENASVPVVNALTDMHHPCQTMATFMTVLEHKGRLEGLKLAYVGEGNNILHGLMLGAALLGLELTSASPPGYLPRESVVERTMGIARGTGARVVVQSDPRAAVEGADVVYTDVWASTGERTSPPGVIEAFRGYQVDRGLLSSAAPDVIVSHCLPARRGEEISAEVLEGDRSVVYDEAENRMHVQKGVLAFLMGDPGVVGRLAAAAAAGG